MIDCFFQFACHVRALTGVSPVHTHIDVTMDVYNHVSEMSRIESEITRLENVAIS